MLLCNCKNEETIQNIKAEVIDFSPVEGGRNTIITLNGKNFGSDIENVRVTINGKDLIVKEVTDDKIVAEVPKGTSSGIVRIIIGERPNAQVLIYKETFTYISNQVVTTYLGSNGAGETDGDFSTAKLSKPRYLMWGKDNALYVVEDGGKTADDMACIRKIENNNVKTLLGVTSLIQ